jgi:aryl-alcohol dehydrogenase-like predicted oxidoreductase
MKRVGQIPSVAKPVSRIVLGTMILSTERKQRGFDLLDAAYACGITTFDTAAVYAGGDSERCLGAWMAERGLRDQVVVLDKGCHHNADRKRVTPFDLAADLHDALARLQTDYVDIYLLHRDDPAVPVGPIVEALNEHYLAGRIRAFGVSNWTHDRIQQALDYSAERGLVPFNISSPNYGLAEQVNDPWGPGCVSLSGPQNQAAREWYVRNQLAVFAYSSLARGLLSGRLSRSNYRELADDACQRAYCHEANFARLDRARELARKKGVTVAQLGLAFVLNSPMNTFALVGAQNREECEACIGALDIELSVSELGWLDLGVSSPDR